MATVRAGGERRHSEDSGTIIVHVRLFAALRRFLPPGVDDPIERTLPAGATVVDLLNAIGVPEDIDPTVAINGELAERQDALPNGADVMVLSPMEGGSRPVPTSSQRAMNRSLSSPVSSTRSRRQ